MKAAVLLVVVCLLAVALADLPLHDKKGPAGKKKEAKSPFGLKKHSSSHTSASSKSQSSHSRGNPEVIAKKAVEIFGDADGSAAFEGEKVKEDTIAEVPPKNKKHSSGSGSGSGSGSHKHKKLDLLGKLGSGSGSHKHSGSGSHKHSGSGSHKHSSSGSSSSSQSENVRFKRPLFNFKDVPAGTDTVVIRKHHFGAKHHGLVRKFANAHPKDNLILVVDATTPKGRPSKKAGDKKKRGLKKSDVSLTGIKHNNVFIFDDKFTQLFPKKGSSSSSKSSGTSGSSKSSSPGLLDKLKGAAKGVADAAGAGLKKVAGDIKNAANKLRN